MSRALAPMATGTPDCSRSLSPTCRRNGPNDRMWRDPSERPPA
jgi:hypothetical protein